MELYFGNEAQQQGLIDTLAEAAQKGKSKLHLVCGGTVCGKSTTLEEVRNKLESNGKFSLLATPEEIEEGAIPRAVPAKLAAQLAAMSNEDARTYVQHYVYKHEDKPLYVVVADGETPPAHAAERQMLNDIAALVGNAKREGGYDVVWIADAPILHQKAPVFKADASSRKEKKDFDMAVKTLLAEHKGQVAAHMLNYDIANTKECLWEHISTDGQPFLDELKKTSHWDNSPEWQKAAKAALAGDQDGFDAAFAELAKRASRSKGVAA